MPLSKTLIQNKKVFLAYNQFRKNIFQHLAPKESETILLLVPWLLSINHPDFPGYIPDLDKPFRVFDIEKNKEIKKREPAFKKQFKCYDQGSLLKYATEYCDILGVYTIGSIATISQTPHSDCDLWVCIDRAGFSDIQFDQLSQKVYLIKDWLDATLKMPVYFFISDITNIQRGNFGNVSDEGCGSTQKNVLKEEFYRTAVVICGKIPFWWVYFNPEKPQSYEEALREYMHPNFGQDDCVDLGDLLPIERSEYFGAALWQFNKALTHPLKSIIKMLLLVVQMELPPEALFCHRFRDLILGTGRDKSFIDPSMFTLDAVLAHYEKHHHPDFDFLKKCFYLRYEIKLMSKKMTIKERLSSELFKKYKLDRQILYELNRFQAWSFQTHQEFGVKILTLLLEMYKDISSMTKNVSGLIAPQDLTIIGRKLASSLARKEGKLPIMHKPVDAVNVPDLTFRFESRKWRVAPANDSAMTLVEHVDVVYCVAYLVWNDLFEAVNIRMVPNPTSVTIQEIINLAKKIREVFGSYNITAVDFQNFLQPEKITKILIVVDFEATRESAAGSNYRVIMENNWSEMFIKQFSATKKLMAFFEEEAALIQDVEKNYYIQRNILNYEKIIDRTRKAVARILSRGEL
ncbi:MAG: class I adenylate cyclase [Syntrophales bacterium]|jgi:adenylate cyclase class 1|nr:class I adenylate cyclase [Syntrophales bacterium]